MILYKSVVQRDGECLLDFVNKVFLTIFTNKNL